MCKFNPKNDSRRIDPCMIPLVNWLKEHHYVVMACCCGHSKYPMTVVVKGIDTIKNQPFLFELLSGVDIPRKRKFYKKDKQGYYYILEVKNDKNS